MTILKIALAVPLRRTFDYHAGSLPTEKLLPGSRVMVPFGKQKKKTGVIIGQSSHSDIAPKKLKTVQCVLDEQPLLCAQDMKLLKWTADYYHHPLGEVIFNALPVLLRQEHALKEKVSMAWSLTEAGKSFKPDDLKRAPKQKAALNILRSSARPLTTSEMENQLLNCRNPLKALQEKGLVKKCETTGDPGTPSPIETVDIKLNQEQEAARTKILQSMDKDDVFLLDGITGSGKTEVYISIIKKVIDSGKQALILSPEIGLTPQLIDRIKSQTAARLAILHSGLSDSERLQAWLDARDGKADIVIGTRSAIWTPMLNPGLFIVDEEHDLSYKQQDGLKFSARDLAIIRGKFTGSPVILGTATPSMESLHNAMSGKYQRLTLEKMAGSASSPDVRIIDLRNRVLQGALSRPLIEAIEHELSQGRQAMLFLNRRGYAPALMCHHCAWLARCDRCDVNMTYHKHNRRLSCHHCNRTQEAVVSCPECQESELVEVGHGTERLAETLTASFPEARIARVDRDTTRRKGSMASILEQIKKGEVDILIGTQMLAKGHHFPGLGLVGIIDVDGGLCSSDFRASERMAQLFIQVSGRAGRESRQGTVLLQTHFPEHPLLLSLIKDGYHAFARALLNERQQSALPPYNYMALLRSEGLEKQLQYNFLEKAARDLRKSAGQLEVYGPIPAPMEKRAGKYRMQLLVLSDSRRSLARNLGNLCLDIESWAESKRVRWSVDIDPQDML